MEIANPSQWHVDRKPFVKPFKPPAEHLIVGNYPHSPFLESGARFTLNIQKKEQPKKDSFNLQSQRL